MVSTRKSDRRARPRRLDRLVIEAISPELDAGRYPIKRIVGDQLSVGADIIHSGDGQLAARLMYKSPDADEFMSIPMAYDDPADRWHASVTLDQVGRWTFAIEAWTDRFATWRSRLQQTVAAGADPTADLAAGARLARGASRSTRSAGPRASLLMTAKVLEDRRNTSIEKRVQRALDDDFLALMREHHRPSDLTRFSRDIAVAVDAARARCGAWYELSKQSLGMIRETTERLSHVAELGLDIMKLPSLYAVGTTEIDPAIGTLADLDQFTDAARAHGMDVALGVSLSCAPDHPWIAEHADWFHPAADGMARVLDLWSDDHDGLWSAIRDSLLAWTQHGVIAFCVENPHRYPSAFWEWLIDSVHRTHPEVLFVAESFIRPKGMRHLAKLGFSLSYTYFMWKTTPIELRATFEELSSDEMTGYYRGLLFVGSGEISNEYLLKGGVSAYRVRLLLAATLLPQYGIDSGFVRDVGSALDPDIARLNGIRGAQAALRRSDNLSFHTSENPAVVVYRKAGRTGEDNILVIVNTDARVAQDAIVHIPIAAMGFAADEPYIVHDLLTGARFTWRGERNYVRLDPAAQPGHLFLVERAIEAHIS